MISGRVNLFESSLDIAIFRFLLLNTMGIFKRNEYIPHGNELVPYENKFMHIGNEFIPTLCWNLHKPKPPKIKTFLMEKVS